MDEKNTLRIEQFLRKHPHYIYHTIPFKEFIEEAFNCKYHFITGTKDDEIKILLPITSIKSKIFGNKIISSSYIEYGGFVGDFRLFSEIVLSLQEKFKADNDYLEIRGNILGNHPTLGKYMKKENLYKRFVLDLEGDVWKGIQKSKRKAIKKSHGLVEIKGVQEPELDEFYQLYLENMKRFGSPPYSKKYFQSFYKHLVSKGMGKILGSYVEGKLVSALLGFTYGNRVHILIAISDPKSQELRPNDATHWSFIKWAIENKYKHFDFGRVREGSGQYEYKRKWGGELIDLPSYFMLWNTQDVPITDPNSAKYKLMVSTWKKLPLKITEKLGMKLRKELGI
jgi:serine/alanine adding enzyme